MATFWLFILAFLLEYSQQECISSLSAAGFTKIVGYRYFANQSLAIIESSGKYFVFSSSGTLDHSETFQLPTDPSTGTARKVATAVVGNSSEVYLFSTYEESYRYSNGAVQATSVYGAGSSKRLRSYNFLNSLPNLSLIMAQNVINILQVSSGSFGYVGSYSLGVSTYLNNSYYCRLSANPLTNEWVVATMSNKVYIGGFDWNAAGYWEHKDSSAAVNSSLLNDTTAWTISSSVGISTSFISYIRLVLVQTWPKYDQELVVKQRPSGATSASLLLKGYYVHSTAIHPTQNTVYMYTTYGDLYSASFTTGPLTINTPVLIASGLFIKYADLEVLDSTTLAIKTMDSFATFDLNTNTLKAVMFAKPAFGRDLPGLTKMLLVYQNLFAKLYDTTTHQIDTSFSLTAKIREIIFNTNSGRPRFYVLTDNDLQTFTYSGAISQVASVTKAQVLSMISGLGVVSIYSMNDIDISKNYPSTLVLLCYCRLAASDLSVAVLLDEQTLSYIGSAQPSNDMNYMMVFAVNTSIAGSDVVHLFSVDAMMTFSMTSASALTQTGSYNYAFTHDATDDPWMASVNTALIPSFVKASSRWLASSSSTLMAGSFQYIQRFVRFKTATDTRSTGNYINSPLDPQSGLMDSLTGYLADHRVTNRPFSFVIWWVSPSETSTITSDSIPGGVAYQSPADGQIYITDGNGTLSSISSTDCYYNASVPDTKVFDYCTVANCLTCNLMNSSMCKQCNSPYLLSADGSACLSVCNPAFDLGGACTATCPLDYLYYVTGSNKCVTDAYCSGTLGKKILGDRCKTSCPAGGTVNGSQYCVAPAGQAISATSNSTYVTQCPGGEVFWKHFRECILPSQLPTTGYTQTATVAYCDGSTHFYDVDSQRCLTTCGLLQGTDATIGKFCTSSTTCTTTLSRYVDNNGSPGQCVATCQTIHWTDLVNKQCIPSCPIGTYSQISTKTCVASCPGGTYLLSTNSSCLTSTECLAASLLTSPSTAVCSSVCSAGLYLYIPGSSCLTVPECVAVESGTGKTAPSTMVCSSSCQAGLFLLSSSSQCLTDSECLATPPASGGGLLDTYTSNCVSSCSAGRYLLASSSQCLNAGDCQAAYSNAGLLSEVDGQCVSSCGASQYKKVSTSQCLTSSECLATSGNTGLLSEMDKQCITTCQSSQYLLSSARTCLLETECWASSNLVIPSSRNCNPSCSSTQFKDPASKYCYTSPECVSIGSLTRIGSPHGTCVTSCPISEYKDIEDSACRTNLDCNAIGKLVENNTRVCSTNCPDAYPYQFQGECSSDCPLIIEESNNTCVTACMENVTADARYCQRSVQFNIIQANQLQNKTIKIHISVEFTKDPEDKITSFSGNLNQLIGGIYLKTNSSSENKSCTLDQTSIIFDNSTFQLSCSGSNVGDLVTLDLNFVQNLKANLYRIYFESMTLSANLPRNDSSSNEDKDVARIKSVSTVAITGAGVLGAATPFIITAAMNTRGASMLCFAAQTYGKLILMTNFNFSLAQNSYSSMYYESFKEFFDQYNENLLDKMLGSSLASSMKESICKMGYEKYCFLTASDNFILTKFLDLLVLGANALILVMAWSIFKLLKKTKWSSDLMSNLKNSLLYSFAVENNQSIWFYLFLNSAIQVYDHPLLAILKVLAMILLPCYLLIQVLVSFDFKLKEGRIKRIVDSMRQNFSKIYEELGSKDSSTKMMRVYFAHDLLFAACLMLTKVSGAFQLAVWLAAEIVAVVMISFNSGSFSHKSLFIRQLIAETSFLGLTAAMLSTHFTDDNRTTLAILYISLGLLWADMTFCCGYFVYQMVVKFREWRNKKIFSVNKLVESNKNSASSIGEGKTNGISKSKVHPKSLTKRAVENLFSRKPEWERVKLESPPSSRVIISESSNMKPGLRTDQIPEKNTVNSQLSSKIKIGKKMVMGRFKIKK